MFRNKFMKMLHISFEEIWTKFKSFEGYEYEEGSGFPIVEFIGEWKSRLKEARSVGCDYSSTILALKLLGLQQNYR